LERTIKSLIAQEDDRWHCYLMDDDSGDETWGVILKLAQGSHFTVCDHLLAPGERSQSTRYSVLINEILPDLDSGIVGFLCDNVEYSPRLVAEVLSFFEANDAHSGYVLHQRDLWRKNGERVGDASLAGHWNQTPPRKWDYIGSPAGVLDHSQVFHRVPVDVRWDENISAVGMGDGLYFTKLVEECGPIYAINHNEVLTTEHLFL